jgi:hypothetical protein
VEDDCIIFVIVLISDVLNPSTDDIIDESLSLTKYPKANSPAIVAIEDGNDCINNNDQKACETTKHKRKVKGINLELLMFV